MESDSSQIKVLTFETQNDFLDTIEKLAYIESPLNELASSPKVIAY